ncbi:60S ribosomal protein L23a [Plecturocebus cupreus]
MEANTKEAPALSYVPVSTFYVHPKAEAKVKTLKAKKAALKGVHSHKENKSHTSPTFQFPRTTESAMKKTEGNNTLVFTVAVKANKHQIRQAVRKLCDTEVAEANTLISLMETGKHMFNWLLDTMLWMLPAKLGSSKLSPAG